MTENLKKAISAIKDLVGKQDISILAFVFDSEDTGVVNLVKTKHVEDELKLTDDDQAVVACKIGMTLLQAMQEEEGNVLKAAITYASESYLGHLDS